MREKKTEIIIKECITCPYVRVAEVDEDGVASWLCGRKIRALKTDNSGWYPIPDWCDLPNFDESIDSHILKYPVG